MEKQISLEMRQNCEVDQNRKVLGMITVIDIFIDICFWVCTLQSWLVRDCVSDWQMIKPIDKPRLIRIEGLVLKFPSS